MSSIILHQSKSSTSIFQTVCLFYAFLCVINPLSTAQLLLMFLMKCLVFPDSLKYSAVLAVAFETGTLRHLCPNSSSQHFYYICSGIPFLAVYYYSTCPWCWHPIYL